MNKSKGLSTIEMIVLVLIIITMIIVLIPIFNSITEMIDDEKGFNKDQYLEEWNQGEDKNNSDAPVKIFNTE